MRFLKIDKAIYKANDKTKVYSFFKRNPNWMKENKDLLEKNKKSIDGYTRLLRNRKSKIFKHKNSEQ